MNKIKFLRESKGLTQQNLADHLGLGRSTVAMYETDKSEPDFATLIKLSKLFDVTIDDIVCDTIAKCVAATRNSEAAADSAADAGDYTKARVVNDFTNKAKITSALKEIIVLPKAKEKLILQILNDNEKACGNKCELLSAFGELGIRDQCDVLSCVRELQANSATQKTKQSAAGSESENGVMSTYQKK